MEKRSQEHPIPCENYQIGCMWGLANMFDIRPPDSDRKLLPDVRHVNRHGHDTGYLRSRHNSVSNFDENCQGLMVGENRSLTVDFSEASIKKLMAGEMSSGQCIKKQVAPAKIENIQSDSEFCQWPKHQKKASKDHPKACDIPAHGWKNLANVRHHQPSHPNKSSGIDAKRSITSAKHDRLDEINLVLAQKSEAAEAFVNQKLFVGKYMRKDGANHQSKQFLDALAVLNSNKELFLKLLEDPNSLLVKHIQDLRDSQAEKEPAKSSLEGRHSEYEGAQHTPKLQKKNGHSHFWKKLKWDRYPSKRSSSRQPSNKIEVSEPHLTSMQNFENKTRLFSSLQHHSNLRKNGKNVSNDHQRSEDVGGRIGRRIVGRSLPSEAQFGTEYTAKSSIDAKKKNKIGKPKDSEPSITLEIGSTSGSSSKNTKLPAARYSKRNESSIYIEARKHLSEMLSNEGKDEFFPTKQISKPLGTILSLPGYDFYSTLSPQWETEHGFVTAEMRFSPYSNFQTGCENKRWHQKEKNATSCPSSSAQNLEAPLCANKKKLHNHWQVSDSKPNLQQHHFPDAKLHEGIYSIRDDISAEADLKIVETTYTRHLGISNCSETALEPGHTLITGSNQRADATNMCGKNEYLEDSKLDASLEHQPPAFPLDVSPSSPSSIEETEDLDSDKVRTDQPSPVSVLEPFPVEDTTHPSSINSKHAKQPMQPLEINFEEYSSDNTKICPSDPEIRPDTSMEDHQFTARYVKAVLEAYGLNWDEVLTDWQSADLLSDSSLLDKLGSSPMEFCNNPKLLYDCINEVALEVYHRHFRYLPWISFIRPKIQPVPREREVVLEIMKGVDGLLLPQLPRSSTEDHVQRDVAKPGAWMDLQAELEDMVTDIVETSLEALIEETLVEQQT